MIELVQRQPGGTQSNASEPAGLRGSGWIIAAFYLFAAGMFTSWAMGTGPSSNAGPAPTHHTMNSAAASGAGTTGSAPAH